MTVRMCIRLHGQEVACELASPSDVEALGSHLRMLANVNARLFRTSVHFDPFVIPYRPDNFADHVVFSDVRVLLERGYGSCGELAAAYAGYFLADGIPAVVLVHRVAENSYHVTCRSRGTVYDPERIGTPWR